MKITNQFIALVIFSTTILFGQEANKKQKENNSKIERGANGIEAPQVVEGDVIFSDGTNNLLRITDEGNFGAIEINSGTPSSTTNKLYNVGGTLKFNGADIGSAGGSSGGWTDNGTQIYNTTLTDKVGIGTNNPLSPLSVGGPGSSDIGILGSAPTTTGTGIYGTSSAGIGVSSYVAAGTGVHGEVSIGTGVRGVVNDYSYSGNIAGNFSLQTGPGYAVYGSASGSGLHKNYGGFFEAKGDSGIGIYGLSTSTNETILTYGGYFEANSTRGRGIFAVSNGSNGRGVIGEANGVTSRGVLGRTTGASARGVHGIASDDGVNSENYGGYFETAGGKGYGVYGNASNATDAVNNNTTYGGYFISEASHGIGVYGRAASDVFVAGSEGRYGGYFSAEKGFGVYGETNGTSAELAGVYGISKNTTASYTYGGYFLSNGSHGKGVSGIADGQYAIGVSGTSEGESGIGVFGRGSGTNGIGVKGYGSVAGTSYDFDAQGPGVNYGATSSIRWKRNIVEIDRPLEKLSRLRGVYFDWDEEHGGAKDIGCIAEEVGKVLPEIVVYEENGIDADGMDYSKLTPLLIEVAKKQQKIIDNLSRRVTELENK